MVLILSGRTDCAVTSILNTADIIKTQIIHNMSCSTWFGLLLTGTIILSVSCESIKMYDQFDNLDSKNDGK